MVRRRPQARVTIPARRRSGLSPRASPLEHPRSDCYRGEHALPGPKQRDCGAGVSRTVNRVRARGLTGARALAGGSRPAGLALALMACTGSIVGCGGSSKSGGGGNQAAESAPGVPGDGEAAREAQAAKQRATQLKKSEPPKKRNSSRNSKRPSARRRTTPRRPRRRPKKRRSTRATPTSTRPRRPRSTRATKKQATKPSKPAKPTKTLRRKPSRKSGS